MASACPEPCYLPLCFSTGRSHPLLLPSFTYALETSHQVFRGTHFIVDKLLITAYLLFPNTQGKQLPKAITGYVSGEGTAWHPCFPFCCASSVTCTGSGEVSGYLMNFLMRNKGIWSISGWADRNAAVYQHACGQFIAYYSLWGSASWAWK